MNSSAISCIYFSPTGTTKAIVDSIAQGIDARSVDMIDLTKPSNRDACGMAFEDGVVIVATPVYYGRVPEVVAVYLSQLTARRTAAVLVVVYGNRGYGDAAKELHDIALARHFIPLACGVFVAEHSYSSIDCPIAHDRPDDRDLNKAREFGGAVRNKLQRVASVESLPSLTVPGHVPYVEAENLNVIRRARLSAPWTPETDTSLCMRCGQCVEACPTGAISPDDVTRTDRWKCLICFACIKTCPEGARQMDEPNLQAAIRGLHESCQDRKEPEVYM